MHLAVPSRAGFKAGTQDLYPNDVTVESLVFFPPSPWGFRMELIFYSGAENFGDANSSEGLAFIC